MAVGLGSLIGLALTAAGTGVDYYNQSETNKKQSNAEQIALLDQQAKQKQATALVQNQVGKVAASNPQAENAAATQGFINTLRKNATTATPAGPALSGNTKVGQRFAASTAANTGAANDYSTGLANDIAGVVAPQRQRVDEGQGFMDTATGVGGVQQAAQKQSFVDQLRAKSIQENPWLGLAGNVLKGAGMATSLGAGAGLGSAGATAGDVSANTAAETGTGADLAGQSVGAGEAASDAALTASPDFASQLASGVSQYGNYGLTTAQGANAALGTANGVNAAQTAAWLKRARNFGT